jgi:predicted TIM-barrel fold metal-dependent hydrolase
MELVGTESGLRGINASELVPLLDSAGIQHALLLSTAYMFGNPFRTVDDEYAKVKAANDWTADQAAKYPGRLQAFCGFNPLKDYAVEELERCAADPRVSGGIKLHFGNSDVRLEDSMHVARLRRVFAAANRHQMAMVIHLRANISHQRPYGAQQAHAFLELVRTAAADIPIQIAHLAGSGPLYQDSAADSVLVVLIGAVKRHDPGARNLWFDASGQVMKGATPEQLGLIGRRIREAGVSRVLYGSDAAVPGNTPPEAWARFRTLPLTDAEFRTIAENVPPYVKWKK